MSTKAKVISELLALQRTQQLPSPGVTFQNLVSQWGGRAYSELSVLLAAYRAMALIHQSAHWVCRGDQFYGDHLLMERLYNDANGFIDQIAEKAVGIGGEMLVEPKLQLIQMNLIFDACNFNSMPSENDLVLRSLVTEQYVLTFVNFALETLKENFVLTQGIENFLQGLADAAENRCYLLKQRLRKEKLT
jgi:hypothetical protein